MFNESRIIPTIPVKDLERARKFYSDTLGLASTFEQETGTLFSAGEGGVYIYQPPPEGSERTLASIEVKDIRAAVKELEDKGVRFEDYDTPNLKTEDHVAQMGGVAIAWFRDSEGNILGLSEGADS